MRHDILGLQVPMDDLMPMQLHQPIDQMLDDLNCLFLRNSSLIINLFLESRTIAVLQDENLQIVIPENVITLHQIGTIELIH